MNSRTKRLAVGAATVLSAAVFTVASASSAQAAAGGSWTTNDVKIRKGPSTGTAIVDRGYIGDGADVKCWLSGEGVYGNTKWYYVRNVSSSAGVYGYTSAYYFRVAGGASVPKC
ncbi:hypothetical protein [Streptomyces sp. NPDC059814]|uniref:hypothetical protein n=1 Tax=Streptomyces sp. NPDC059814 TaxID=3346959 RepID=UPI00365059DB